MAGNDNQVPAGLLRRLVREVLAGALPLAATAVFRRGLLAGFLREDRLADSRRTSAVSTSDQQRRHQKQHDRLAERLRTEIGRAHV